MASATTGISIDNVRKSVRRMQTEGERLVGRIRKDARELANGNRREALARILKDAQRLPNDLRHRVEETLSELDSRRTRITKRFEERGNAIADRVVRSLRLASVADIAELGRRLDGIERRLSDLGSKGKAA